MSRTTTALLLLALLLSGCKLLLGPPLRPGVWDLTLTGMDVGDSCEADGAVYSGRTTFEGAKIDWPYMQQIEVTSWGDADDFEVGDFPGFDMEFDGEQAFDAEGIEGAIELAAGACETHETDVHFELDDREHLHGSATLNDLIGPNCNVPTGCAVQMWFEADWVERD